MNQNDNRTRAKITTATLLALSILGAGLVFAAPAATAGTCTGHSAGSSCYGVYLPRGVSQGTCVGAHVDDHCTGVQV